MDISEITIDLVTLAALLGVLVTLVWKIASHEKKHDKDVAVIKQEVDSVKIEQKSFCTIEIYKSTVDRIVKIEKSIEEMYNSRNEANQEIASMRQDIKNIKETVGKQEKVSERMGEILTKIEINIAVIAESAKINKAKEV